LVEFAEGAVDAAVVEGEVALEFGEVVVVVAFSDEGVGEEEGGAVRAGVAEALVFVGPGVEEVGVVGVVLGSEAVVGGFVPVGADELAGEEAVFHAFEAVEAALHGDEFIDEEGGVAGAIREGGVDLVGDGLVVGRVFAGQAGEIGKGAVGDGILRGTGFAVRGSRAGALLRVEAIGGDLFEGGHSRLLFGEMGH
jgi:hypothetical protein